MTHAEASLHVAAPTTGPGRACQREPLKLCVRHLASNAIWFENIPFVWNTHRGPLQRGTTPAAMDRRVQRRNDGQPPCTAPRNVLTQPVGDWSGCARQLAAAPALCVRHATTQHLCSQTRCVSMHLHPEAP